MLWNVTVIIGPMVKCNVTDSFILSQRNNEHLAFHEYMLQHCPVHYITYFVWIVFLNISVHVFFKAAQDLYFLWWRIHHITLLNCKLTEIFSRFDGVRKSL